VTSAGYAVLSDIRDNNVNSSLGRPLFSCSACINEGSGRRLAGE
jgi:hypothetical protein